MKMDDPAAVDDFIKKMSAGEELGSGDTPSLEQLMKMLDGLEGMTDEEKSKLKSEMFMEALKAAGSVKPPMGSQSYVVFFVMLAIVVSVFGT